MALGEIEKNVMLSVTPELGGSTIFEELGLVNPLKKYTVSMTRFDVLFADRDWKRPCLCKIDVQGSELKVLEGMGKKIFLLDMIIVEASFFPFFKGGPQLIEVFDFMYTNNFVLLDIVSIDRRPLDGLPGQTDLVFIRHDDPLRADKRWNM